MSNSGAIRTWMKNEGIFDKDLESILEENGIKNPETDFKSITQTQWDEIVRQATVARQRETQDTKARMRLEEKMVKVENFWRKESGIEKTNIKTDSAANTSTKATKNIPLKSQEEEKEALSSAAELKKWMQKEEIWEKDLFVVLTKHSITCEDEISKIDSQPSYDEIIREVTVLRAADTKDSDAKMRLEKLLAKFEKLWRAKTGIEKTNINSASKASKSQEDTKNTPLKSQEEEKDALVNAGELKKYMQKEEIWEKDLFVVLTKNGITCEEEIIKIDTQTKFDEVIREVTVLRSSETKDKDAKMRLEKLLAKFEKIWREKTGVQKTNINSSKVSQSSQDSKNTPLKSQEEQKDALANAGELKKYMQKEEIWEKDLFVVLTKNGVTCEEEIIKIDTQTKFDEVVREVTVLRSSETKDKDAKMRLEKLLAKFENIWRTKTGIEKTNVKQGMSDNKKKAPPKDTENEKMATQGKGLKTWMQSNEIWEKALYDELMANGIKDESDLVTVTQVQFDEIIRKVRVDRFSNMKDQSSRQRLDKLLVSFEKLWRAKSGVQKTNIK